MDFLLEENKQLKDTVNDLQATKNVLEKENSSLHKMHLDFINRVDGGCDELDTFLKSLQETGVIIERDIYRLQNALNSLFTDFIVNLKPQLCDTQGSLEMDSHVDNCKDNNTFLKLENRCNVQTEEIDQLRQQLDNVEKENNVLNNIVAKHENRLSSLIQEFDYLKNKLQQVEKNNDERNEQSLLLKGELEDVSNRLQEVSNNEGKFYLRNECLKTEFETVRDQFILIMSRYMRYLMESNDEIDELSNKYSRFSNEQKGSKEIPNSGKSKPKSATCKTKSVFCLRQKMLLSSIPVSPKSVKPNKSRSTDKLFNRKTKEIDYCVEYEQNSYENTIRELLRLAKLLDVYSTDEK